MRRLSFAGQLGCIAAALLLAASCGNREPAPGTGQTPEVGRAVAPVVTEVSLGRAVNSAQQIDRPTEEFAPADTIYASIKTENTPAGTRIMARWVYTQGGAEQVVSENELVTTEAGTGYTSFHVINPSPWPAGSYEVRVGLNGEIKETKGFSVRG
jgi:hypothetical protein